MKFTYFWLLLVLLTACQTTPASDNETSEAIVEEPATSESKEPVTMEPSSMDTTYYEYEGNINGNIPVSFHVYRQDDLLKGELIYKRVGNPITLIGDVEGGYCRLLEIFPDGNISGILSGQMTGNGEWHWFNPKKREDFDMSVTLSKVSDETINFAAKDDVTGSYRYSYGEEGYLGNLTVHKVQDNTIHYDIACFTQAPARNMAVLEDETAPFDGKEAIEKFSDDEMDANCEFRIRFYDGFAKIDYVDDRMDCMFGHNAHVSGIFRKTK